MANRGTENLGNSPDKPPYIGQGLLTQKTIGVGGKKKKKVKIEDLIA